MIHHLHQRHQNSFALPRKPKPPNGDLGLLMCVWILGACVYVLMCSLFNHHLHQRHKNSFADPAGCSSYGALHATCKDKAPRERSTQRTPSRNLTLGGKPAVPAVSKFEPGQGIPPFSLISASTRLSFQLHLGGCFLPSL